MGRGTQRNTKFGTMNVSWQILSWDDLSKEDFYQIAHNRAEVFVVEQECAYQDLDLKDQESYHVIGRDEEGDLVAYTRILKPGVSYHETSIGRVLVVEKARGLNLGKEVMKRSMDFIRNEMGQKNIRLSAQEYLMRFYEDLGYVSTGKHYLEDDIPHVEMLWSLKVDKEN